MWGGSHRASTKKAVELFHEIFNGIKERTIGSDPLINRIVSGSAATDTMRDLEFVDVDLGRDNPHSTDLLEDSDEGHYSEGGKNLTAFNHFIDIKKGPGRFDDYDGYSYKRGSASSEEFQDASDAIEIEDVETFFGEILSRISGMKIDEGLNWWLNDEYVHASCHKWYRNCSPSLDRYSFPEDKGIYRNVKSELKARFPLADCMGESGKGIPYSVFMPVDNLAHYWYGYAIRSGSFDAFSNVLHAIQDATVPHHTAGYMGNWHTEYERDLNGAIDEILADTAFKSDVLRMVDAWNREDVSPPTKLEHEDWQRVPAKNWRIDRLVTWNALHAFKAYEDRYQRFKNGYTPDWNSIKELTAIAVAMSVLAMIKITEERGGPVFTYIANIRTKELHFPDCRQLTKMNESNKAFYPLYELAVRENPAYDGCYYCMRRKHTD